MNENLEDRVYLLQSKLKDAKCRLAQLKGWEADYLGTRIVAFERHLLVLRYQMFFAEENHC